MWSFFMHKFILPTILLSAMFILSACGDSDATSSNSSVKQPKSGDVETIKKVKSIYDLGECTDSREGELVLVQKNNLYYQCNDEDWFQMEMSSIEESSSSKKVSSSSKAKSSSSKAKSSSSKVKSSSSKKSGSSKESSSSKAKSSSSVSSSSHMDLSVEYDCSEYKCVTTEYLNQDLLDSGMYGQFLDVRDSQVYRTIEIGSQIWMAQNLNFETEESACYDNQDSNCVIYGRLYYQTEALTACPPGWHLPSNEEWNALDSIVHSLKVGNDGNGNYLKSLSTWTGETGNDQFGFSGLASLYFGDVYVCGGYHGVYWTSDTYRYRCLLNDKSSLYAYYEIYAKDWGMAVRCLLGDVETSSD